MNTNTLVAAMPALNTLNTLATLGVGRRGAALRMRMPHDAMSATVEAETVKQLLDVGATVQICKVGAVWTPTLAKDGVVVWAKRATAATRKHVTVVVGL